MENIHLNHESLRKTTKCCDRNQTLNFSVLDSRGHKLQASKNQLMSPKFHLIKGLRNAYGIFFLCLAYLERKMSFASALKNAVVSLKVVADKGIL